jgi:hypothetical protein
MSDFRLLGTHKTWSPWFPTQTAHDIVDSDRSFIILNAFTVGILVLGLAQLEYVALQRWQEVAEIVLGLWLIASPAIFGYANDGLMLLWHCVLGVFVVLLGALQLWQDWELSDQDLLKHGQ